VGRTGRKKGGRMNDKWIRGRITGGPKGKKRIGNKIKENPE
jgi:hypothetical protein